MRLRTQYLLSNSKRLTKNENLLKNKHFVNCKTNGLFKVQTYSTELLQFPLPECFSARDMI